MDFKKIRELRNEIAHEYADERFKDICKDVIEYTPVLQGAVKRTADYIKDGKQQPF